VKYLAERGGAGANHIEIYELHKNTNLYFTPATSAKLTGGDSATTWRIKIDFSGLGLASLRQLWLTFAPRLADGAAYSADEWSAVFTNWTVTDPRAGSSRTGSTTGDKVSIEYHCQYTHDLYVGTALYKDRGIAGIKLESGRRDRPGHLPQCRAGGGDVSAGAHTVEIRVKAGPGPDLLQIGPSRPTTIRATGAGEFVNSGPCGPGTPNLVYPV